MAHNTAWPAMARHVTRYDKTVSIYLAALHVVGVMIWSVSRSEEAAWLKRTA
ncbi:hypothetical protein ACF1A5_05640 [Streptomyces sp. NPDC014864]|uniref:hypothetical protein n=1 Tax=Streptomyces sp. NPDC014864 TaxID=3364924 RepID=UPI0036FD1C44